MNMYYSEYTVASTLTSLLWATFLLGHLSITPLIGNYSTLDTLHMFITSNKWSTHSHVSVTTTILHTVFDLYMDLVVLIDYWIHSLIPL